MAENSATALRKGFAFHPWAWVRSNPVILKELRGRMRGNRAFILLTFYLLLMAFIVGLVYAVYLASIDDLSRAFAAANTRQTFGKIVFWVVVGQEMICVSVISPALTSTGITSEREHLTYDLLRTTLLSPRALVYGKFLSGFIFILLMLFAALPMQSLAFLFGGVAPEEVLISALILIVSAANFCAIGIFCSSLFKRSVFATAMSYAIPLLWVFGVPLFLFLLGTFSSAVFYNQFSDIDQMSVEAQRIFLLGLWLLVSLNPGSTMLVTELILSDNNSLWTYNVPLSGSTTVQVLSPWIPHIFISLLFTLLFLLLSMKLVQRTER